MRLSIKAVILVTKTLLIKGCAVLGSCMVLVELLYWSLRLKLCIQALAFSVTFLVETHLSRRFILR